MDDHSKDAIAYVSGGLAQYISGAESHKRFMEWMQQEPLDHNKQRQTIESLIRQAGSTGEATITLAELLVLHHHYDGVCFETVEADAWCEYWRREVLRKHPTPEAYELVCKARDKWQERAERAAQDRDGLGELLQQIEQEPDRLRAENAAAVRINNQAYADGLYASEEIITAMRAELEWYAQTDLGTRAEDLLARYPNEGEAPRK